MIRENAVVVGRKGSHIEIEVQRQGSCSQCSLSKGCGIGAIGRLMARRHKPVIIDNELNLKPGDHILIGIPEQGYVKASLLVYGLPLVLLITLSLIAHSVSDGSEVIVLVGAIGGFLAGMFLSSGMIEKRYKSQLNPKILQVNNEPIN